jgi:hypothetical protein
MADFQYPPDVPPPGVVREDLKSTEHKAIFDLTCMSTAYAFCHELRHVMYAQDENAPTSRPDEEIACDAWAREFLTARLTRYAESSGYDYKDLLRKRSIAAAIGIFTLYESTERDGDGGTDEYPPLSDRMDATLRGTPLASDDPFWVVYAAVLVAILRRRGIKLDLACPNAKELCARLTEEVGRTS